MAVSGVSYGKKNCGSRKEKKDLQVAATKREKKCEKNIEKKKKQSKGNRQGCCVGEGRKGRRKSWHSLLSVLSSQTHVFLFV